MRSAYSRPSRPDVKVVASGRRGTPASSPTTPTWPNAESDLAGHEIVYRDTTAPYWTHVVRTGRTTTRRHVIGITKDNVMFGVRAVDRDGNRSPAAFPRPVE